MSNFVRTNIRIMKKLLYALPILFLLTACPIGLDYAPGEVGTEKVSAELLGTWEFSSASDTSTDHEVKKVKFSKRDNYSYSVTVLERGEMYALESNELVMYQTTIDGLNVMYLKPSDEDKYYLYQFEIKDKKTLVVGDISLLDGGVDVVTSTETLREQIKNSKGNDEFLNLEKFTFVKK